MQLSNLLPVFLALLAGHLTHALITLQTIRNLTELTDDCRERITGITVEGLVEIDEMARVLGRTQQVMLTGGDEDEDGDEVEVTVAAALGLLCSSLLVELEKPLDSQSSQSPVSPNECGKVIDEYHLFIGATVKFLHEVHERQMMWRWNAESGVFQGVGWLQGLWASRKTNSQDRSFIEQQMSMYAATGCFGKSKEVLRRDVEIVEYLNDLIDSFG